MERFEWQVARRKVKAARCPEHGALVFTGVCEECQEQYGYEDLAEAALEAYLSVSGEGN